MPGRLGMESGLSRLGQVTLASRGTSCGLRASRSETFTREDMAPEWLPGVLSRALGRVSGSSSAKR